jgi:hypothetical protein
VPPGSDSNAGDPRFQRNPPWYTEPPASAATKRRVPLRADPVGDPQHVIGDPLAAARKAYPGIRCQPQHDRGIRIVALSPSPIE